MQSYKDFESEIQKRCTHKNMKVKNSWGAYDAYKWMRKNNWYDIGKPVKEHEFYAIIRGVNNILAESIANGETVTFPHRMGHLELRKKEKGASIVNGELKVTYPIDWSSTIKLWYEDVEARKKKTLLRRNNKYVYRVLYDKYKANYENKGLYLFTLNRKIKLALKENINQGKIETLW